MPMISISLGTTGKGLKGLKKPIVAIQANLKSAENALINLNQMIQH